MTPTQAMAIKGTRVRLSKAGKAMLRKHSRAHLREFQHMIGISDGLMRWPKSGLGPEVNVYWGTTGLRYAYHPDMLELVPSIVRLTVRLGELHMAIDHQGFRIAIDHDPKEMKPVARARWYRKQLRIALERLARHGL